MHFSKDKFLTKKLSLCSWHAQQQHKIQVALNNFVVNFSDNFFLIFQGLEDKATNDIKN